MTLLGAFPAKGRLGDFDDHRLDAIEQFFSQLPDAPDLTDAARASKAIGTSDYPMVRRHPTPRPGLALIGDAATSSDPVPAVGCGWAFRSAEFLADSVIPAFDGRTSMRAALRAYRRKHRFIDGHDRLLRTDARGHGPNPVQRAIRRAALHDDDIATRLGRFGMRADAASALVNPRTALRRDADLPASTRPARRALVAESAVLTHRPRRHDAASGRGPSAPSFAERRSPWPKNPPRGRAWAW